MRDARRSVRSRGADVIMYDPDITSPDPAIGSTRWLTEDWKLRLSPRAECAWRFVPAPTKE